MEKLKELSSKTIKTFFLASHTIQLFTYLLLNFSKKGKKSLYNGEIDIFINRLCKNIGIF